MVDGQNRVLQTSLAIFLVLLYGAWTVGARWNRIIPRSMFWAGIGKRHNFSLLLFLFFIIFAAVKDRSTIHIVGLLNGFFKNKITSSFGRINLVSI